MSKELSPLEALDLLPKKYGANMWNCEEYQIVKTALKEYEMEHTLRIRLENINYELVREQQENEKKLKLFEIIKNKFEISKPVGFDIENNRVAFGCLIQKKDLTQEEYDLLKEVLL